MALNDPHTKDWIKVKHPGTGGETEIPPKSLESFRSRGWVPLSETTPSAKASAEEHREWAAEVDPEHTEDIASMTKTEIRRRYSTDDKS